YVNIAKTNPAPNPVTSTGNNPRGRRIKWVPRTPKNLADGNNPRGVAIRPHRYVPQPVYPKYSPPKSSSGGGILAAINPVTIIEHIPSDIEHIPADIAHVA